MAITSVSSTFLTAIQQNSSVLLRRGSRGADVIELQRALKAAGFDPGPIDGIFGGRTDAAVHAFQRQQGLVIDGIVGRQTWGALARVLDAASALPPPTSSVTAFTPPSAVLDQGDHGTHVRTLQHALKDLGFNPGPVDGIFGRQTTAAVVAFQRSVGLSTDGVVGPRTWAAIAANINGTAGPVDGIDGGDTPTLEPIPTPGATGVGDHPDQINLPRTLVKWGSRGQAVKSLQAVLNGLGHNAGPIDGIFGPKTDAAVRAFQRAHSLTVDGIVGPQTWGALEAAIGGAGPVAPVDQPVVTADLPPLQRTLRYIPGQLRRGADVTTLQQTLLDRGFNPNGVDGVFGPGTAAAVKTFQRSVGLLATGVVGHATWFALGGPENAGFASIYSTEPYRLSALSPIEIETYTSWKMSSRPSGLDPKGIVWHHTASRHGTGPAVVRGFATSDRRASADFVIGADGHIWQMLPNGSTSRIDSLADFKSWHAGIGSSWTAPDGTTYTGSGVNSSTIGIEIVNRGDGSEPYPEAQLVAVARLTRWLQELFDIPTSGITGHRDVAPSRKIDPSDNFPMELMLNAVDTGYWDPTGERATG